MNSSQIVALLVTAAGASGVWAFLGAVGKNRNDLAALVHDETGDLIKTLREELDRVRENGAARLAEAEARIAELQAQDQRCRDEIARLTREIATLRGRSPRRKP